MRHASNENGKRHVTERVTLPNQVVIRTHPEKETYKYMGILEADTIKQYNQHKKIIFQKSKKITSDKTLLQEPYQRDKYLGCLPSQLLGTILEIDQRTTYTNRPENKKTNDHAQGTASQT